MIGRLRWLLLTGGIADEDDPDTMEEIDLDNIVGSRTRGRQIDFAKAAENLPEEDDDEDDDDDFEAPEDEDKMEE
jgi:Histone chaperone domain CHZ